MTEALGVVLLLLSIVSTALAQVCQKYTARSLSMPNDSVASAPGRLSMFYQKAFWYSLFFLGLALIFWLLVLQVLPLSRAYPSLALSHVLVLFLAKLYYKETISRRRWLGVALIVSGTIVLALG